MAADTEPETAKTFFGRVSQFKQPEDGQIFLKDVLIAAEEFVPFFDVLSSMGAFKPCKSDILGNVKKIRKKMDQHPGQFATFEDIIKYEIENKETSKSDCASTAILWLFRAFQYNYGILTRFVKTKEENLKSMFYEAYEESLSKHHNWLARKIFQGLCSMVPYRSKIVDKLTSQNSSLNDQADLDISTYCETLGPTLDCLQVLLMQNDIK